jgi:hypothetical protein
MQKNSVDDDDGDAYGNGGGCDHRNCWEQTRCATRSENKREICGGEEQSGCGKHRYVRPEGRHVRWSGGRRRRRWMRRRPLERWGGIASRCATKEEETRYPCGKYKMRNSSAPSTAGDSIAAEGCGGDGWMRWRRRRLGERDERAMREMNADTDKTERRIQRESRERMILYIYRMYQCIILFGFHGWENKKGSGCDSRRDVRSG